MAVDLDKLQQLLLNKLRERFGDAIIDLTADRGELTLVVDRKPIVAVMTMLRDDPDFQFNFLSYLTAVDYLALGRTPRYDVVYQLYSIPKTHRLRVRAAVPEDDPTIDSVFPVWRTANFIEREAYDMFGILFQGHPDLRRILMPDDWEGHPLRKDFPLGGVKSFYFKRSSDPHAGEPKDLVPRIRVQESDI
ncbi:MAG: NADH-quinone oxidoreductase subunit C [Candidatus Sumerlaeia bacterium]|nr:NADH-quinone oxidoreductase subunit C [Candidatus Sumerlaeia bacterium]